MTLTPAQLAARLSGVLSFPTTPFDEQGRVDLEIFRRHIRAQLDGAPAAIFPACGTGEFFSLNLEEYRIVVATAVEEVAGRIPVVAGVGYGTALAVSMGRLASEAGADGLLALPPYLVNAPQRGLVAHFRAIAESTSLGVIVYQRDNVILDVESVASLAEVENIVGLKEGHGDVEHLQRLLLGASGDLVLLNGMPTAEITAQAFAGLGITTYSSAVFGFAPELSQHFHAALSEGDTETVRRMLQVFFLPFVELRDRVPGYAVALIKAGQRLLGLPVGRVRAPLVDLSPEHEAELEDIIKAGLQLVAELDVRSRPSLVG